MKRRDFVSLAGLAAALPVARGAVPFETATAPGGKTVEEPPRATPVVAEGDVVVCGGGPAASSSPRPPHAVADRVFRARKDFPRPCLKTGFSALRSQA